DRHQHGVVGGPGAAVALHRPRRRHGHDHPASPRPRRPIRTEPRPMTDPVPVEDLTYAEALAELESILDRLEHAEPDVDRIAADVARAADLVRQCRGRIETARLSVEDVVGGLTGPTADG